jgi:hypothetical protein
MRKQSGHLRVLSGLGVLLSLAATGCQLDIGGQTLPSPFWQQDDVQYFPPGAEFKLAREAAAMQTLQRAGDVAAPASAVPPAPGAIPGAVVAPLPAPGAVPVVPPAAP